MEIKSFNKGETYKFKSSGRTFEILKGSRDLIGGMLKIKDSYDNVNECSCDFLKRQLYFGFVEKV